MKKILLLSLILLAMCFGVETSDTLTELTTPDSAATIVDDTTTAAVIDTTTTESVKETALTKSTIASPTKDSLKSEQTAAHTDEKAVKKKKAKKTPAVYAFYPKMKNKYLPMIFFVLGGLTIFLLGMNHMSSGLQTVAGPKLRSMVAAVTNNRFMAAIIGTMVTVIVQSSSVTTVMVVGFVNSSIMTLNQALGVIFGANIGTTITGWIVALKIGKYGLPMLAVAGLIYLFSKKDRVKYTAMAIMGVGMVFFGLQLMSMGFKPVAADPNFEAFFGMFHADNYMGVMKCVLAGAILTAFVQSSSATLAITMTIASTVNPITGMPIISFETAAALVLGENIGTTITAFLASFNTNTSAKRAAYGHMLFNVIGVLWITAIFGFYIDVIEALFNSFSGFLTEFFGKGKGGSGESAVKIAMVHTGFNIINTLAFLPALPFLAKLLYKIVPEKEYTEKAHLSDLSSHTMHDSPSLAVEAAKAEVDKMAEICVDMNERVKKLLESGKYDEEDVKKLFELEETMDIYQKEISEYLMDMLASKSLSHEVAETIQRLFRFADEYESISDYIVSTLKRALKLEDEETPLVNGEKEDILALHNHVHAYLLLVNDSVKMCQYDNFAKLRTEFEATKLFFKEKRLAHLTRLSEEKVSPFFSLTYMDMLTNYRKLNAHLLNISEVLSKN